MTKLLNTWMVIYCCRKEAGIKKGDEYPGAGKGFFEKTGYGESEEIEITC